MTKSCMLVRLTVWSACWQGCPRDEGHDEPQVLAADEGAVQGQQGVLQIIHDVCFLDYWSCRDNTRRSVTGIKPAAYVC